MRGIALLGSTGSIGTTALRVLDRQHVEVHRLSGPFTVAPRAAKPIAVALPIPDPAPDTTATLPSNRIVTLRVTSLSEKPS